MTTKHTPGPWTFSADWAPGGNRTGIRLKSGNLTLAEIFDDIPAGSENVCLISAAPDLLVALQIIDSHAAELPEWIRQVARAAIAKAEVSQIKTMNDRTTYTLDTDLTNAQILRWLKVKADELAKELNAPSLSIHTHTYAGGPQESYKVALSDGCGIRVTGDSLAEVAEKYRAARLSRAAELRADADRLEREAEAAKLEGAR